MIIFHLGLMYPLAAFICGILLSCLLLKDQSSNEAERLVDNSEMPGQYSLDDLAVAKKELQDLADGVIEARETFFTYQGSNFANLMHSAPSTEARNLLALRYLYRRNQSDFGKLLNTTQVNVSQWERGHLCAEKHLEKIFEVTGYPKYLFCKYYVEKEYGMPRKVIESIKSHLLQPN